MSNMPSAEVIESWIVDCASEHRPAHETQWLRQFATILRQTTKGTASRQCQLCKNEFMQPFVCTTCGAEKLYDATLESITEQRDHLEQRMKVVEAETIERCAKVCEVMGAKHFECPEMSEYCADAIRALKVEPTQTIGGNDPEYLAEVFWRERERRNTCLWTEMDEDTNNWDTSCGTAWTIVDGTPTSNEIKYCHGCGLLIKVADKPLHGADGRLIQRRKGERRVKHVMNVAGNYRERSGTDRRKK